MVGSRTTSTGASGRKLHLFEKEGIYSEYWFQNELSLVLPWSDEGYYFVDRGQGVAIPDEKPRYPDFILCFNNSQGNDIYWLELKDLLTNPDRNLMNLHAAIKSMCRVDRSATLQRWRNAKGQLSSKCNEFADVIESRRNFVGGLIIGPTRKIPSEICGLELKRLQISKDFTLGYCFKEIWNQRISQKETDIVHEKNEKVITQNRNRKHSYEKKENGDEKLQNAPNPYLQKVIALKGAWESSGGIVVEGQRELLFQRERIGGPLHAMVSILSLKSPVVKAETIFRACPYTTKHLIIKNCVSGKGRDEIKEKWGGIKLKEGLKLFLDVLSLMECKILSNIIWSNSHSQL